MNITYKTRDKIEQRGGRFARPTLVSITRWNDTARTELYVIECDAWVYRDGKRHELPAVMGSHVEIANHWIEAVDARVRELAAEKAVSLASRVRMGWQSPMPEPAA